MRGMVRIIYIQIKGISWQAISVLALPLLLIACATQTPTPATSVPGQPAPFVVAPPKNTAEQELLRNLIAHQDRLYRVASPILVNNADLCKGSARNLLGFTAKNKYSFSSELIQAAETLYAMDDRLQVMGVLAGSGAARMGIKRGDKIISAEGMSIPYGEHAERSAAAVLAPLVSKNSSIKLTVLRNGTEVSVAVPLTRACAYSVELGNTDNVNAYDDGKRVLVTRGMMHFARTDEELAYVLAKEIAHNILQHASKQKISNTVADIIDNLARIRPDMGAMAGMGGIRPMPAELDTAADTLAMYMAARAGYNINGAPRFWERLSIQHPATVLNGYTAIHPSISARLAVMEKTVADIKSRQAARRPLIPPALL